MREYNRNDTPCRHNIGVLCEETGRQCDKCGWNPRVSRRRANNIRETLRRIGKGWTWIWRQL